MKKLFAIMMALTLLVAFSGQAAAELSGVDADFGTADQTGDSMLYSLSNNVFMDYSADTVDYALGAKHRSGNRIYYTTNNTSNIFYVESDTYKGSTDVGTIPAIGATSITGTAM